MKEILKNSMLYRVWMLLYTGYCHSALAQIGRAFSSSYPYSKTKALYQKFIWSPMFGENKTSVYVRLLQKLVGVAQWFCACVRQSAIYRVAIAVGRPFYNIANDGYIARICRFFNVRRFLIISIALYLPLDYFLRAQAPTIISSLWDEALMLFAIAYICWRRSKQNNTCATRATPIDAYIFLFVGVMFFLMCVISPYWGIAVDGLRAVVQYVFWFFIIIRLVEDDRDFAILYGTLVLAAFIIGLHGIYQYIIAAPIPEGWVSQTEESVRTRVYSITGSPNIMGSFLVLFAPMAAGLAYYAKKTWLKFAALGAAFVMCLSILFTFSKGAWGGLVVAIIIFALYLDRRLLGLMTIGGAGALLLVPSIANRITYLFTADYAAASARAGRAIRWATGLQLLNANNKWLGFGLGRFGGAVAMQNKVIEETDTFQYFYMDNYYLKTLVETGYLGLLVFIVLLIGMSLWCLRSLGRTRRTDVHPLAVSMFSGMCGVLVHCYFENIFEVPYMMGYFWILAAAIMYLGYFRKRIQAKSL